MATMTARPSLHRRLVLTASVGLVTALVAGLASYGVARALVDDDVGASADGPTSTGDLVPLVRPVGISGDAWDAARPLARRVAQERELASDAGVGVDPGVAYGPSERSPASGALPAELGPGTGRTATDGEAPAAEPTADPVPGPAVDLCTLPDAGVECPDGVGGTVLGLRELLPFYAFLHEPRPPGEALSPTISECAPAGPAAGTHQLGFTADRVVRGSLVVAREEDGAVTTRAVETTASQAAAWRTAVEDPDTTDAERAYWINHCVVLEDLAEGHYTATLDVEDVDAPGSTPTGRLSAFFTVGEPGPAHVRRPTVVANVGVDRVAVSAPGGEEETVAVHAIRGADATCDTGGRDDVITRGASDRTVASLLSTSTVPADVRSAPGYPYLVSDTKQHTYALDLDPGATFAVCVYWYRAGPDFDRVRVTAAERILVSTPAVHRPVITLEGFTNRFSTPKSISVRANGDCGPGAEATFDAAFEPSTRLEPPRVVCDPGRRLPGLSALSDSVEIEMELVDFDDRVYTSTSRVALGLACSRAPCPPRADEVALVPMPSVPTERALCGSGFGAGCSVETPHRSAGDAVLSLRFSSDPAATSAGWSIGAATPVTDTPTPPADDPQASVRVVEEAVPQPWREGTSWTVTVTTDRPTTARAALTPDDEAETETDRPCATRPAGARDDQASDRLGTEHRFTFTGICYGSRHVVTLSGQDSSGTPLVVASPSAGPNRIRLWPGGLPGVLTGSLRVAPPDRPRVVVDVGHGSLTVPGARSFTLYSTATDTAAGLAGLRDAGWHAWTSDRYCSSRAPGALVLPVQTDMAAAYQRVRVTIPVEVHEATGDCAPGELVHRAELSATVDLADLVAGITLRSEDGAVRATLSFVAER